MRATRVVPAIVLVAVLAGSQVSSANQNAPGHHPASVDGETVPSPSGSPRPDKLRWASAEGCSGKAQRGARDVLRFLEHWWARGESWGIYDCRLPSLHSEGRAVDFHLDVKDRKDRRAGHAIRRFFAARDEDGVKWAMARRFGVQEIIFDCRVWGAERSREGWRRYFQCDEPGANRTLKHRDHIHIGLNWRGATRGTTAWTGFRDRSADRGLRQDAGW